jgi:tRNA U34 5-methylaminomethyl-2-thiouridine-forming methyltransferase MnmC
LITILYDRLFKDLDVYQNDLKTIILGSYSVNTPQAPDKHQWIQTEDGSYTLFSEAFQEACHSTSGAREETQLHYIKGCQVKEKSLTQNTLTILEVGFGLGIGLLETLKALENFKGAWHFVSLEIDENLLEWFQHQHHDHPILKNFEWMTSGDLKILSLDFQNIKISILCGDARKTLPEFISQSPLKWDAVYQDAFSPKKNPILWTKEWFTLLKNSSAQDVILSTYSASSSIRKSLVEAGWKLSKGDKFGPKRTSTRAKLQGESDEDILLQLSRSPVSALTDDNLSELLRK